MKKLFVFKRMTAILLTLIILVSMLPVVGLATETEILTDDFSAGLDNWTQEVGTVDEGVYTVCQ